MFGLGLGSKFVKNLRKDQGFTIIELANHLKIDALEIKRVDQLKLKDVPEPLKSKLVSLFRGDHQDKIPW